MTPDFNDYTVSTHYDQRLYAQDIEGSIAHARMLAKQEIITSEDCKRIVDGLLAIQTEINSTEFVWDPSLEDLHMNIEKRLFELIGSAAGRLHTGRSRNDQVSTDVRLYVKDTITAVIRGIRDVQNSLVEVGSKYSKVIMPGYTHLQRAQPVLFAHHMLAYFHMLERDVGRFSDCCVRADVLPLGSGALAGVPYPTDRDFLAAELGFAAVTENSMDALMSLKDKGIDAIVMLGTGMPTLQPILNCANWNGPPVTSCMLSLSWRTMLYIDRKGASLDDILAWSSGEDWRQKMRAHGL